MELFEAIAARHSYRGRYADTPVPRAHLQQIMEAGLAAPSGCNKQTTFLIGVDDRNLLSELLGIMDPPVCATAPAAILVLTKRRIAYTDGYGQPRCYAVQDYAAAIENMLLAVTALGYASCWIEGHITDADEQGKRMAERLQVPPEYGLVCILPVGVPLEEPKLPRKRAFSERAWFNGFGGGVSPTGGSRLK